MIHLDTWNTSYGQKKGRESNWQFDSLSLKVGNWPDFLSCSWCATYHWKAFNDGYNFAQDLVTIGGLHAKLWAPKVEGVPIVGISGLPFGSPGTKCHLDVALMERHKIYFKGEGGGFPQIRAMVSLVNPRLLMARPNTKSAQTMHWPMCCLVLCRSKWVNKLLVILPSPILELQHTPLPPKCCEPRSVPQILALFLFSLQTHIWVY
jgi:hypothetical protein